MMDGNLEANVGCHRRNNHHYKNADANEDDDFLLQNPICKRKGVIQRNAISNINIKGNKRIVFNRQDLTLLNFINKFTNDITIIIYTHRLCDTMCYNKEYW